MKIYQGEPIGFKFNAKNDDRTYVPSFEGMRIEALLASEEQKVVKTWSTDDGSISIGVETAGTVEKAYAAFSVSGAETAEYKPGLYTLEIAYALSGDDGGRAIGKVVREICIEPALIRKGI